MRRRSVVPAEVEPRAVRAPARRPAPMRRRWALGLLALAAVAVVAVPALATDRAGKEEGDPGSSLFSWSPRRLLSGGSLGLGMWSLCPLGIVTCTSTVAYSGRLATRTTVISEPKPAAPAAAPAKAAGGGATGSTGTTTTPGSGTGGGGAPQGSTAAQTGTAQPGGEPYTDYYTISDTDTTGGATGVPGSGTTTAPAVLPETTTQGVFGGGGNVGQGIGGSAVPTGTAGR
ncbi:hypothetical protein HYH03_007457 [Edaphochlamys debaryana]|uniref:Uncharacterized protein n=1 Tax=Edaphochlamys debaryana TaxID=47281 RepID=A0A835Y8K4_9CHLO|nr:hypothetical protein HYH03_007457 [Edaphochlamys debaryana]|eukprot:KAG2494405.1 hypothetical protein HYH03_007457 [Edaphochlamys debaryana]